MAAVHLDEDSIDEILYLARANEAAELSTYLDGLAASTRQSKPALLAAAADPYSKNTALHYAAANGHVDIIKLLLSFGSTAGLINACNDSGNTALHWAALNGHLESVQSLVQLGADVTIINKAGHDAVFEAEINDKGDVVEWLLATIDELEKGVGGDKDHDDGGEGGDTDDSGAVGNGQGSGTSVEHVRARMETLDTKGPSQGG